VYPTKGGSYPWWAGAQRGINRVGLELVSCEGNSDRPDSVYSAPRYARIKPPWYPPWTKPDASGESAQPVDLGAFTSPFRRFYNVCNHRFKWLGIWPIKPGCKDLSFTTTQIILIPSTSTSQPLHFVFMEEGRGEISKANTDTSNLHHYFIS
jgi:hypothetical protein